MMRRSIRVAGLRRLSCLAPMPPTTSALDVYSIGAMLQFLLTGESAGAADGSGLYPVATVFPNFERLLDARACRRAQRSVSERRASFAKR